MKTLLVGINAKFIHSNLAIRYLKYYAEQKLNLHINTREFTINHQLKFILREIVKEKPDVLGFSCYIWNYELIKKLVYELKKLMPETLIILGGPEVSYDSRQVIKATRCDVVVCGEGELPFTKLLERLSKSESYTDIEGIACCDQYKIVRNAPGKPIPLDEIPFVYHDFDKLENRIIYYESTRGCPFRCQYCLSSDSGGVRFLSLERIFHDLSIFLNANVRQVKFVDRTFNCNKQHAMAIWQYIMEHDNGYTNFHFEIAAELLDRSIIDYLMHARKGLFQFEIGVQSVNDDTLKAIKRRTDTTKLTQVIQHLQRGKNIHLHLDLIAGLPYEGYHSFMRSFNYVYELHPDQLQLGFLKLLKGSGLYKDAAKYGLVYTNYAPYEILKTNWLSYEEILKLQMIEEMVEQYYNSNRYQLLVRYLCSFFTSPFHFYEALAEYYESNNLHMLSHSNLETYTILWDFFQAQNIGDPETFQWYALFDLYSHEKAKKLPEWLIVSLKENYHDAIYAFFDKRENVEKYLSEYLDLDTKQILRSAHIEVFPFNPITNEEGITPILFNYRNCDILGNAKYHMITLSQQNS